MKFKFIFAVGILSILYSCDSRESLGGKYYLNKEKNLIQYRYSIGGALTWNYSDLESADIRSFKVFSREYATDKKNVYFAGSPIKGVSPNGFQIVEEYPSLFAKNTKSKHLLYKDSIIDINFQTVKIHSPNYVSDINKVVYIAKKGVSKYGQFHIVPVKDVASFGEFKSISRNGTSISHDKYYIYLDGINTKISSNKAQILQLGLPTIILQNNVLHYIYPSYRKEETIFKDLKLPFIVTSHGIIDSLMYDDFYHFSIQGFKQAERISNSKWIKDTNGLYFINDSKIHNVSNKQFTQYTYDERHPKYIKTSESLIQVQIYPYKIFQYSTKAKILDDELVKDQNKIYYEGTEIKNVDANTFSKLPKSGGFVDKDFYYYRGFHTKQNIPSWAYKELLDGKNPNDLFGIDMKYSHTVYKTYWNGFLVSLSMPTKQNESSKILLEFKNIARKTIELKKPIEEQIYISYQPHGTELPVYYQDDPTFDLNTEYDYKSIKNEESIQLQFSFNHKMIKQKTVTINGNSVLPYLILSNKNFVLERNDYDLHIMASKD